MTGINANDWQVSDDDIITDEVEYDDPVVDIADDWHTGQPRLGEMPDLAPYAEVIHAVSQQIAQEIKREQLRIAQTEKSFVRVSTNLSASTQFRRYSLDGTMSATQIVREKMYRGDTVITVYEGELSISDEPGLFFQGANTCSIVGPASRTVRTRKELWAICEATTVFDVQEEFDP